ncbi:FIG001454: Transglutaminase-like enzymes, putative cysteine proteases [hydrothermal vent metagenome]|uniref:FIG001454: Transglutaminase-like enzymes, putative cysteine proteases n=1 Tax=hydrothermal vent metagenome TaxID=652676 RepID=A0A1W1CW01_9ZZZZ
MKFSPSSLNTRLSKPISSLGLIDMAYIVTLLPLFVMLKIPMIAFLFMIISLLVFKKSPAKNALVFLVFMLGILALFLSLYGAFSFSGLSRLRIFLELLVYILIVVVSMQRLTQKINFYLLISPFLFLALSLFFYHGMLMLTYVVFEIFFLLWMVLSHRMEGKLIESFSTSMVMFMYSLPWVVILFIFFPRISFEHASYGFKGENIQRMGHDGTMFLDGNALLVPSNRIVMEVGFESDVPPASMLYFRGSMLYVDKKDHWEGLPSYLKRKPFVLPQSTEATINYKITLYPTQKKWLYMLDMPSTLVDKSSIDADLISTVKKDIKDPIHYEGSSSLSAFYKIPLEKAIQKYTTAYNQTQNPQVYERALEIQKKYSNVSHRATAIENFFKAQELTYTLKPDALDTNRSSDSFLFDKKRGYCVHFASSFVTMARMSGIPSRIVTGYKSDGSDAMKNYLAVREKDAHAWAELYINGAWTRFETTATATYIDEDSEALLNQKSHPIIEKINLYLMYIKYQVETWILYYSHIRQLELLAYAKANPSFIVGFVTSIIALLIISFMIVGYFRRPRYSSKALEILAPLVKSLEKKGYSREDNESILEYYR